MRGKMRTGLIRLANTPAKAFSYARGRKSNAKRPLLRLG
jgi:hypothetical protein